MGKAIVPCVYCGSETAGVYGWITALRHAPDIRTCHAIDCKRRARRTQDDEHAAAWKRRMFL